MELRRPDFLEPLVEVAAWFKGLVPTSLPGRPHFNFLTVHYIYLISLTIIGSILMYPAGVMRYIDALFFAAGAATQSGLNTLNVNDLKLYQQIVIMLVGCIANPVFINTVVVFIRLHWFEKRFQGIVKEVNKIRRSRTISRTRSQARSQAREDNTPDVEQGVRGRRITVLHETTTPNGMSNPAMTTKLNGHAPEGVIAEASGSSSNESAITSSEEPPSHTDESTSHDDHPSTYEDHLSSHEDESSSHEPDQQPAPFHRDIVFADELAQRDDPSTGVPIERRRRRMSAEHHIALVEKQRSKDHGTLRIPGPRDFERGDVPHQIDSDEEDDDNAVTQASRPQSRKRSRRNSEASAPTELNADDHPMRKGIAFDVPDRPERSKGSRNTNEQPSTRFNPLRPFSGLKRTATSTSLTKSLQSLRDAAPTISLSKSQERDMGELMPYLSWQPTIKRNSAFVDLTEEQREELGGIEYRSLKTLAIILVFYYAGIHVLGAIVMIPWIELSRTYGGIPGESAQNDVWWGIFTPASMFNDLGFTLTPDSMISFNTAILPLLFGSWLIIVGNTGFPCFLRFVIWLFHKCVPRESAIWEELRFLLDHPRRCFTLLFPSRATWWLFWLLVLLNGTDLVLFIILDLNDTAVTSLAPGNRVLDGWFQAVSTRTAGFAVVNLAALHPAIQVSYMVMMYISVFPIAISIRRTNVYEEKSLGIWSTDEEEDHEGNVSYVGMHLRRQLSFDLWYIFLGLFVIAICEAKRIEDPNEPAFTLFAVLFEIVSAYGTVGLSLGYPNIDESFSAEFSVLSKLVVIAMMIRGRHRGLPYALDRAILLPSEKMHRKESEDPALRAGRRNSMSMARATTEEKESAIDDTLTNTVSNQALGGPLSAVTTGNVTQFRRTHTRRPSELSVASARTTATATNKTKRRGLTGLLSAGLGAGPSHGRPFKDE